jgi:hypothetical protein
MSKEDKKEDIIDIKESPDGSAVIELPADIKSPDVNDEVEEKKVEEDSDEADEAARAAEMAEGGAIDPEAEAVREAKREKRRARKEYQRKVSAEKDTKLHLLEKQNQELLERLSVVEKKTQGSEMARLNKAVEDMETRILFAKSKIKEATENGDGELLASAQEMWYDARRNHDALVNLRQRSVAPQPQPTIQAPDPLVQRYASDWMEDNPWYDPHGRDPDSKVALTIDQSMADEGWNPKSQEYWEELNNRLAKYLPHRYSGAVESVNPSTRRPRNVVTSSGRENAVSSGGKGNTFTLTPDQVRAMKDAGMWDDPEKRAKMIRRYATEKLSQR